MNLCTLSKIEQILVKLIYDIITISLQRKFTHQKDIYKQRQNEIHISNIVKKQAKCKSTSFRRRLICKNHKAVTKTQNLILGTPQAFPFLASSNENQYCTYILKLALQKQNPIRNQTKEDQIKSVQENSRRLCNSTKEYFLPTAWWRASRSPDSAAETRDGGKQVFSECQVSSLSSRRAAPSPSSPRRPSGAASEIAHVLGALHREAIGRRDHATWLGGVDDGLTVRGFFRLDLGIFLFAVLQTSVRVGSFPINLLN